MAPNIINAGYFKGIDYSLHFSREVEDFNKNWKRKIADSVWKVFDEIMLDRWTQKTKKGGLPYMSFIKRKL